MDKDKEKDKDRKSKMFCFRALVSISKFSSFCSFNRRLAELQEKGNNTMTLEEILSELIRRDLADESRYLTAHTAVSLLLFSSSLNRVSSPSNFDREHGPLKKADDAIEIDSTEAPVEDIVEKIYALILKKSNEPV